MKVPIGEFAIVDLEAPVLPAYEAVIKGVSRYVVWCKFCKKWHRHGAVEGHREAQSCNGKVSDHLRSACYNRRIP